MHRAVDGLGDLMDDYEFHYPGELNPDNLDEVRAALDGHGIATVCTGLHTRSPLRQGRTDCAGRGDARRGTPTDARDGRAGRALGANMICWPGIEGYNYPFQTEYAQAWEWFIEGMAEAAEICDKHGVKLFLEHKNSEPAMKIFMRNIGMTLHVIHTLRARGITNVQVNMDWQHLIMNGESLGEYAAMLAAEGLLGHQHANSGWGTFDDDNMVGATAFMETLELALELRRANYGANGEHLGFDLYPYTEDAIEAVKRSVLQWRFIDARGGEDRRRGAARGAEPQGCRPGLRAGLRRARCLSDVRRARLADREARRDRLDQPGSHPGRRRRGRARRVRRRLARAAGLEVEHYDAAPGTAQRRRRRAGGGGRSLLLNAHMDTVGVAGHGEPVRAAVRDGRLHGRGAGDMKGSLAAIDAGRRAAVREASAATLSWPPSPTRRSAASARRPSSAARRRTPRS